MTPHKRMAALSPAETHYDNPSHELDTEWETISRDPLKRLAFQTECIDDELTKEKQLILLQENPSSRCHCRFWG
jgi:hypothetical protein